LRIHPSTFLAKPKAAVVEPVAAPVPVPVPVPVAAPKEEVRKYFWHIVDGNGW
jgi:hypothetical protein